MSIKEVLEITINLLGHIAVPRNLNEQIGIPIDNAINNLRLCTEVIEGAEKAKAESKATGEPEEENGGQQDGRDAEAE